MSDSVEAEYRARRDRFAADVRAVTRRWNAIANARLTAFVLGAGLILWGLWNGQPLVVGLGGLALAGFVALAIYHSWLGRIRRESAALLTVNEEALARLERDWAALPAPSPVAVPADHPFAADLDIVGPASLLQLLDTTSTPMGSATLAGWLLTPATPATVTARQPAVAALARELTFRQDLQAQGRLAAAERRDPEPLLAWAEGPRWLAARPLAYVVAWLGPLVTVGLIVAQLAGIVNGPLWVLAFLANLFLSQLLGRAASTITAAVNAQHWSLRGYARQIELIADAEWSEPALTALRATLTAAGEPAPSLLRRLSRLAAWQMPLSSPLWLPLQGLFYWDIHLLAAMERWQATAGPRVRGWLATLGEVEALSALAGLAHDNPEWTMPALNPAVDAFRADGLGHPLLPATSRVVNDVTVGPPGTFLLVTGSNMSGKSTLLRAVGVNAVLAGAGAPVCATSLALPAVALWTSVRVQDSLEQGVSFFMAELQRLKLIVAAARAPRAEQAPRVLYLLDEMLAGTNTVERQIAARRIIAELVARGAIGAVSTHDLALADDPALARQAVPVHFTDLVGDGVNQPMMSFDYQLRPGIATTTNALRLMELVGFDLAGDAPAASAPGASAPAAPARPASDAR